MLPDNLKKYKIVLGSNSPRRKKLLAGLNVDFQVETIEVDESFPAELPKNEISLYIAEKKSQAHDLQQDTLLITADTVVILGEKILGKPKDKNEAKRMLEMLSGKTHTVVTGVCIRTLQKQKTFSSTTNVTFAPLNAEEIDFYVENYETLDKAGAYGVQDWIGFAAVESVEGSFFNVMGLPIQRLYEELKNF